MRITSEGSTTIASTGVAQPLLKPGGTQLVGKCAFVWVGAGDSNNATTGCRVGVTTLNHFIDSTDKKGFQILHDDQSNLQCTGTTSDVIRWVVYK